MAQKIQTLFIDDIDGSEAEGTVRFALDGAEYEIDLNAKHADVSARRCCDTSRPRAEAVALLAGPRGAGAGRRPAD